MKISDMSPMVTEFKNDRSRTVGNWSFADYTSSGVRTRDVYHYSTLMVRFRVDSWAGTVWGVHKVTIGHGTVSDQGGINNLVGSFGFRMARNGGWPRVTNIVTGEIVAD